MSVVGEIMDWWLRRTAPVVEEGLLEARLETTGVRSQQDLTGTEEHR
jgi:hypothetical protein